MLANDLVQVVMEQGKAYVLSARVLKKQLMARDRLDLQALDPGFNIFGLNPMAKKKAANKKELPPVKVAITQQKRDRVAAILALVIGLLSVREGGSVLLGLTIPAYHVLPWLVWYNVTMGVVSVFAGVGMWKQRAWSISLGLNILAFHGIVFLGLIGLEQYGQDVARTSIFAMLFRTFTWIVIYSLLTWKRQDHEETA
jgi:hypothetical protein